MSDSPTKIPVDVRPGCMSDITAKRLSMIELAGALEAIIWKVGEVRELHGMLTENGDSEVMDRMDRTQIGLTKMRAWLLTKAWGKP